MTTPQHLEDIFTPDEDAVLQLRGVRVHRGGRDIVADVDWTVRAGERWVVMGPNGAGKSTLLQIAAARLHPTVGDVAILDEVLGAVDVFELRPRIGLSSAQLAAQVPRAELVQDAVVTAAYGVTGTWRESYETQDRMRALGLVSAWGLSRLAHRPFGSLSDGERKRVLIARALMTDPELLLLDEPAAGLDLAGREELVRQLTELAEDEAAPATVLVTHHVEEVPPGFTHALLLREGGVVAAGPVAEVLTDEHLSTAFGLALTVTSTDGRYSAVGA
ncbi:ABC transporter ATP-binding protein [Micrococcus sp. EYE_162]|uniref:ABC transporter ATP-binding protein n=1 Tax=unclassified Micrococcus TaxID=2620948 RepID=UPI002002FAF1|nr:MULTISPECIES: ABC transporter ATP-binding protein [unclassified Micrococcus]MCK6095717.1 ABC transporter ATP-binding protein [Micrococcus sp. EYE_212]MCK6171792.1 ABC transporter ATP-binding protein [Micrococcus sp. EYE_162]